MTDSLPLAGFRIGVTAARKVDEQVALLERRGATVEWAPALSLDPNHVDDDLLRAATEEVLAAPVDMFLATTGIGMRAWFDAAERWGILPRLLSALESAEILARGPKSVGALRRRGLRELWAPESECFEDVLEHLRGRSLAGLRIVVQEHGQSLSMVAHALRRQGADVTTVTVYRVASADDPEPMFKMVDLVADRSLDAVTFTSAPAVAALMEAAGSTGRRDELVSAFQADVVAACVGPVTAAAFEMWGVPTIYPGRSRLGALVPQLGDGVADGRGRVPLRVAGIVGQGVQAGPAGQTSRPRGVDEAERDRQGQTAARPRASFGATGSRGGVVRPVGGRSPHSGTAPLDRRGSGQGRPAAASADVLRGPGKVATVSSS